MQRDLQTGPGDLARRISYRRQELGLSVEELAKSAGIDPVYLRYFEERPDGRLSVGTLEIVASILGTTRAALLGGDIDRPQGRGRATHHAILEKLTHEQCEAHLAGGGVGRIIFLAPRGPVALPVNYVFAKGELVFRTDVLQAMALVAQEQLGFEVDRVDDALSEGWSVVATGPARRIEDPNEVLKFSGLELEPWAGGDRHALVAVRPYEMTGRVIAHQPG